MKAADSIAVATERTEGAHIAPVPERTASRTLWIVIGGAVLASMVLLAAGGVYLTVPDQHIIGVYIVNRFTGTVTYCVPTGESPPLCYKAQYPQ